MKKNHRISLPIQLDTKLLILGFKELKNVVVVVKTWLGRVSLCPGATHRDIIQPRMFSPFLPFARYILRSQIPIRLKLSFPTALLASKLNISIC